MITSPRAQAAAGFRRRAALARSRRPARRSGAFSPMLSAISGVDRLQPRAEPGPRSPICCRPLAERDRRRAPWRPEWRSRCPDAAARARERCAVLMPTSSPRPYRPAPPPELAGADGRVGLNEELIVADARPACAPAADTMPCVTVWPTRERIADRQHQIADLQRVRVAAIHRMAGNGARGLWHADPRSTARSSAGRAARYRPRTPACRRATTLTSVAPSMTWLLVTTSPGRRTMMTPGAQRPLHPLLRARRRPPSPKKRRKKGSSKNGSCCRFSARVP